MAERYRLNPDGEEYQPYHDTDSQEDYRGGLGSLKEAMHTKGTVHRIEKSSHEGHHEVTIRHDHLAKKGNKDGSQFGAVESAPESRVHIPKGHNLHVGHKVTVHVSAEGRKGQHVEDEGGDEGEQ
jgi:hypothetical protein